MESQRRKALSPYTLQIVHALPALDAFRRTYWACNRRNSIHNSGADLWMNIGCCAPFHMWTPGRCCRLRSNHRSRSVPLGANLVPIGRKQLLPKWYRLLDSNNWFNIYTRSFVACLSFLLINFNKYILTWNFLVGCFGCQRWHCISIHQMQARLSHWCAQAA